MNFKPATWRPIAFVVSLVNLLAAGFAAGQGQPWHATIHVALGLAFGLWAQRLGQGRGGNEVQARLEALGNEVQARLEALEAEAINLRRELGEAQERLDFAERLLAQAPEMRRVDPPR